MNRKKKQRDIQRGKKKKLVEIKRTLRVIICISLVFFFVVWFYFWSMFLKFVNSKVNSKSL